MTLRNKKTGRSFYATYKEWEQDIYPKSDYELIDLGDLVVLYKVLPHGKEESFGLLERLDAEVSKAYHQHQHKDKVNFEIRDAKKTDWAQMNFRYLLIENFEHGETFDQLFEKVGRNFYSWVIDFSNKQRLFLAYIKIQLIWQIPFLPKF